MRGRIILLCDMRDRIILFSVYHPSNSPVSYHQQFISLQFYINISGE